MEGWIGIDCGLPDEGQDVLVTNGRFIDIDYYEDGDWHTVKDTIYWMELPKIPMENKR